MNSEIIVNSGYVINNIYLNQSPTVTGIIFGSNPPAAGNWQIVIATSGNLSFQYYTGSAWVEKSNVSP